jgi:hypothetical protein
MNLAALVILPFLAWHVYRVVHALRTGVFRSLGDPIDRTLMPTSYWFRTARELLLAALFAAVFIVVLLRLGQTMAMWLFATYGAVYVTLLLVTLRRREP